MKALAAIISSGFGNVRDAVLFCHPDRADDLDAWTSGRRVDWVEVELPDSAKFVDIGTPEHPEFILADFDANSEAPAEPKGSFDRNGNLWVYCMGSDHHVRWAVRKAVNE